MLPKSPENIINQKTTDTLVEKKSTTNLVASSDHQRTLPPSSASSSIRIDFRNATSSTDADTMSLMRRRHRDLKNLVQLDKSAPMLLLLDMAPIRDYEYYIQSFGKTGRMQVYTVVVIKLLFYRCKLKPAMKAPIDKCKLMILI